MAGEHSLRYIDKEHAYCICGGWSIVVPRWSVGGDEAGMAEVERRYAEHVGMSVASAVVVTVNGRTA